MAYIPSNPLFSAPQTESSDIGLAFKKGKEALIGSGSVMLRGMGGDFLRSIGLEEMGENWIGDAYARGILMGMDMNEISEKMTGPQTVRDIEDWKGAIAWGVNSVAEQTPTLMMQFAPAVAMFALTKNPASFGGRLAGKTAIGRLAQKNPRTATTLTALGTIDFMNTAEVYSQLMMEAGESRPAVAATTGAAMSALDMVLPLKILGKMGHGSAFAGWFGRRLKNPDQVLKRTIAGALESGVLEGSTEYVQTIFENMATAYVKEEDLWESFQKERALHEQEEAGARGALIGTLLGGGVSFMGARRASKRKAAWLQNFMDEQQRMMRDPQLTHELKFLNAPIEEALGDKIRDSHIDLQVNEARQEVVKEAHQGWQPQGREEDYRRDSALFDAILNSKMEKVLGDADATLFDNLIDKERTKHFLLTNSIIGRERALTPYVEPPAPPVVEEGRETFEGTEPLPIQRGGPLTVPTGGVFASWGEIPTGGAGLIAEGGWRIDRTQPILTAKGNPSMKRGKPDTSNVYVNPTRDITLKRRNETKVSDWVVVENSSGDVIDSGKWRELRDKYEGAPVRQQDYRTDEKLTEEEFTQAGFQKRPSQAEFDVAEATDLSEQYERELSRQGKLLPGVSDRVTIEMADEAGNWGNVDLRTDKQFDTYIVRSVEERSVPRQGRTVGTEPERITAPQYGVTGVTAASSKQTVYTVINDRTGKEEELSILPEEEDDLRIVIRQRGARKAPETVGRVTLADIEFMDEFLSKEEKTALFPFTQEGESIAATQARRENAERFFEYIQDKEFRKRLGDALEEAFNLRGEKVANNISKLQHQSKEEIERFIEESGKTKPRIDEERAGVKRPTLETGLGQRVTEESVIKERERIADEKLHGLEIAALDKAREAKLSKLSEENRKAAKKLETRGASVLTEEEEKQVLDDVAEQVEKEQTQAAVLDTAARKKESAKAKEKLRTLAKGPKKEKDAAKEKTRPKALPKGQNLVDSIDPETEEVPTPATYEVKISPVVAKARGLNPEFFYTYTEVTPDDAAHWKLLESVGVKVGDFISVIGHHIRKDDVVDIQEITGRAKAPTPTLTFAERTEIEQEIEALEEQRKELLSEASKEFKAQVKELQGQYDEAAIYGRLASSPHGLWAKKERTKFIKKLRRLSLSQEGKKYKDLARVAEKEIDALNKVLEEAPSFIRGQSSENKARYRTGYFRGMERIAELPEGIPHPETVREFWIDNKTGIIIIQREASVKLEDIDKMDVDYPYDYEVYVTWYDREEHRIKLAETKDRLLNIYRGTKDKSYKSTKKILPSMVKDFFANFEENSRGAEIEVEVTPSMIRTINNERKKAGLSTLPFTSKFRVSPYYVETGEGPLAMHDVEQLQKIRKSKGLPPIDVLKTGTSGREFITPLKAPSQNKVMITYHGADGSYSRAINVTSIKRGFEKRVTPERVGVMLPYEDLAASGPERGVRLIGSYKGSISSDVADMEQLMADMFVPQTHAFGAFGKNKEAALERRTGQLEEAKGRNVLVEYFDGAAVEGQLIDVNRESNTFTIGIPKAKPRPEAKQRFDYVEVDILGYDRIQAEKKPAEIYTPGKTREELPDDPLDRPLTDNVWYVPIIVRPEQVVRKKPTATPEGLTRLEVRKTGLGTTQKGTRYVIKVDDMEEPNPMGGETFGINQAIGFVNNLVKQTRGMEGIEVVSIPDEILTTELLEVTRTGEAKPRIAGFKKGEFNTPVGTLPLTKVWEPGASPFADLAGPKLGESEASIIKEAEDGTKKIADAVLNNTTPATVVTTEPEVTDTDVTETDVTDVTDVTAPVVESETRENWERKPDESEDDYFERMEGIFPRKENESEDAYYERIEEESTVVTDTITDAESMKKTVSKPPTDTFPKNPPASADTLSQDDAKNKPLIELGIGQTFYDGVGGKWEKVEQIGNYRTLLKFVEGRAPKLEFQVESKGKKDTVPFGPGFLIDADSLSTPGNLYLVSSVKGLETGKKISVKETFDRFQEGKGPPEMINFSVVRPTPDGEFGRMDYNTGLTPATFRDIVGKQIGRFTLARLERDGVVRIVQNQQDVPNAPLGMGVKAVERDGQVWFITNNMKESEVVGTFYHDVGVHVGLLRVYGEEVFQRILDSARELRDSSPEWTAAFDTATKVFNTLHEAPDNLTDKAREQWESVTPEQKEAFITEEAIGYYVEDAPVTDSFWRLLIDFLRRVKGTVKNYLGVKLNEAEIVAFIRGATRGTMNRNNERADNRMYEHYSAAFGLNLDRKAYEYIKKKIDQAENFNTKRRLEALNSIRKNVVKFFEPLAYLPFKGWYKQLRSVAQGRMAEYQEKGKKVLEMYDSLTPEENEQLWNFFTTKNANPLDIKNPKLREASVEYKELIRAIGKEAVSRGLIGPDQIDQYNKLYDAYLPNVFLLHLLSSRNPTSLPTGMTPSQMHWTKERVEMHDRMKEAMQQVKDVNYLVYRAITIPMQDLILVEFLETVSKQSAFIKGQAPWVMPNQWMVVEIDGKKRRRTIASLRREADSWRVLSDASTGKKKEDAIKKAGELEKIVFDFYKKAGISEAASPEVIEAGLDAYYAKELKKHDPNFSTKQYKQIPDQQRFGAMAGLWVRKEIYDDVRGNASQFFGEEGIMGKIFSPHGRHAEWVGIFKTVKVPLNPPSVVRNAFSNTLLLQLSGLPFHKQPEYLGMAIRMYRKQKGDYKTYAVKVDKRNEDGRLVADVQADKKFVDTKEKLNTKRKEDREGKTPEEKKAIDKAYRQAVAEADVVRRNAPRQTETKMMNGFEIAKHYGVGMTTMRAAELNALEAVIKSMEKDGVHGSMFKAKQAWAKLADAGGNMYQMLEMVGKVAMIQYKLDNSQAELEAIRKENVGPDGTPIDLAYAAVMEANDALFDYSEVSSAVRGIRSSFFGAPFITFQVKVVPKMIKTMARYPMRFLPYVGFYMAAQAAFGSIPFKDDEWDKFRELMPEWIRETGHGMLWPFKDSEGRVRAFDASWMVPWGGLTNAIGDMARGNPVQGLQSVGLIPPGFQWGSAILTNEDHFTKRAVYDEKGSSADKGFDILSYAWAQAMPPWLSDRGFIGGSSLIEAAARLDPSLVQGRIIDAMAGRTNRYGEPKRDEVTAILYMMGLNLYPISKNERSMRLKRYATEQRDLRGDITKTRQDRSLSKSQKSRRIEEFRKRIDEAREARKDFVAVTS